MSLPPILVVSLERSKDRRAHMEKELVRFGVDYSFFPAVDGRTLTKEDKERYSMRADLALHGVVLQPSNIGCSLSHARIYERMVAENIPELLVLEDDCILEDHFFEVLKDRNNWLPPGWSIINFRHDEFIRHQYSPDRGSIIESTSYTPMQTFQSSGLELRLVQFKVIYCGTMCYLINTPAARCLLKWMYPIRRRADHLLGNVPLHKLDSYTTSPPLAEVQGATTIRTRGTLKTRWQSLCCAIKYKDARKTYVNFRVQALQRMLRSVYAQLFRK